MADPETRYEYGLTPEETAPGLLGLFNFLKGPVVDAFTPERREVIAPSKTTYQEIDGYAYPTTTPGEYGPPESGLEYMPVVQGAKSAYDFAGKFFSDGKFREQTGSALAKGIEQLFSDYMHAASQGGETTYDPVEKRERTLDPLLPLGMGMSASVLAPVKAGSSMVAGMFAGRNAQTADLGKLKVAEKMAEKGRSRDEIWDQTGWFKFKDRDGNPMGEWKFEVDDSLSRAVSDPAALKPYLTKTGRVKIGAGSKGWGISHGPEIDKLLIHDELYKTYPGKTLEPVIDSLQDITRQRAVLKEELLELKKRISSFRLAPKDYLAELGRLEDADAELIRKLIYALPATAKPGGPAKTARERYPLLDRPIGETVVESTSTGSRDLYGYYKPGLNTMAVRRDMGTTEQERLDAFRSTSLHELQHAIQSREGFEIGGMPSEFVRNPLPAGRGFLTDPKTGKKLTPFEIYQRLVGESEARLVQKRRGMGPGLRRALPPWTMLDESKLLTRKGDIDYWRELGVERKASGGFVDKPLYDDARIGGMI